MGCDASSGVPVKSDAYRAAEDIFYVGINDVSFFVEDDEKENFYLVILRKLFPEISIKKIFPQGGKANVINKARRHSGDVNFVFIVDADFDLLFEEKVEIENLFYLDRYSIENYLLEDVAVQKLILSERPALNAEHIERDFSIDDVISKQRESLNKLLNLFLVCKKNKLAVKTCGRNPGAFFYVDERTVRFNEERFSAFQSEVVQALGDVDARMTLDAQIRRVRGMLDGEEYASLVSIFPGKYLLHVVHLNCRSAFSCRAINKNSLCYRLAEYCRLYSLNELKMKIQAHLQV